MFVLTFFLAGSAWSADGFFDASKKYQEWFNETKRYSETEAPKFTDTKKRRGKKAAPAQPLEPYPYPDKQFQMTEKVWKRSADAIISGKNEWHDTEVIRHGAEVQGHGPAMDLLGWMYQEGRGLEKDYRKAYMWYERAKIAGVEETRGSSAKIYNRLSEREKYFADLQLNEDNKNSKKAPGDFRRIKKHVLSKDRSSEYTINK